MKKGIQFTRKRLVIVIVILILLLGMVFRERLIKTYVVVAREHLATYAENLLDSDDRQSDRYGFWKVRSYPEEQMVEFHTGGFGLAPSSTYKGFYYSADMYIKCFQWRINPLQQWMLMEIMQPGRTERITMAHPCVSLTTGFGMRLLSKNDKMIR